MSLQTFTRQRRQKNIPKVVSSKEAKDKFGTMMEWAADKGNPVVIETHGKPRAVLISFDEFQKIEEIREEARRRKALESLKKLREEVRARNQDITTEEQAMEVADEITRAALESLIEKGKIKFSPR